MALALALQAMNWMPSTTAHIHDVSSLFLFESTGDSETTDFDSALRDQNLDLGDEDAESCSWDSFDETMSCFDEYIGDHDQGRYDSITIDGGCGGDQDRVGFGSSDSTDVINDDEEVVDQIGRGGSGVDHAAMEVKDETEKSRIFWETCFAVGYP